MSDSDTSADGHEVSFALLCITAYGMMFFAPMALYMAGEVQEAADMAVGFVEVWLVLFMLMVVRHAGVYWGGFEALEELYERYIQ